MLIHDGRHGSFSVFQDKDNYIVHVSIYVHHPTIVVWGIKFGPHLSLCQDVQVWHIKQELMPSSDQILQQLYSSIFIHNESSVIQLMISTTVAITLINHCHQTDQWQCVQSLGTKSVADHVPVARQPVLSCLSIHIPTLGRFRRQHIFPWAMTAQQKIFSTHQALSTEQSAVFNIGSWAKTSHKNLLSKVSCSVGWGPPPQLSTSVSQHLCNTQIRQSSGSTCLSSRQSAVSDASSTKQDCSP